MRTFITLTGFCVLAIVCQCYCVDAGSDGKKPQGKISAAEIDKLVNDLGSCKYSTRETAYKSLRETPGVLPHLRRKRKDSDPERRKRIEILINELSPVEFRCLFREMMKDKNETPIDLLMDMILENQQYLVDDDWKSIIEVVAASSKRAWKGRDIRFEPKPLDPGENYLTYPLLRGAEFSFRRLFSHRVIADRIMCTEMLGSNVFVVAGSFEMRDFRGIALIGGNVSREKKAYLDLNVVGSSFVYCDGDLSCKVIFSSIVICRGRIRSDIHDDAIAIELARKSPLVKLFSAESVGLTLEEKKKELRVGGVAANSPAARWGLEAGDVIAIDPAAEDRISVLERMLRKSLVKHEDLTLQIRRQARQRLVVVSFDQ